MDKYRSLPKVLLSPSCFVAGRSMLKGIALLFEFATPALKVVLLVFGVGFGLSGFGAGVFGFSTRIEGPGDGAGKGSVLIGQVFFRFMNETFGQAEFLGDGQGVAVSGFADTQAKGRLHGRDVRLDTGVVDAIVGKRDGFENPDVHGHGGKTLDP